MSAEEILKRMISADEESIRNSIYRTPKTPLEAFTTSLVIEQYRTEAEEFGMLEDYEQAAAIVTEKLIEHEAGKATMADVLRSKVALLLLHRTIDRLKGFSVSMPRYVEYDKS